MAQVSEEPKLIPAIWAQFQDGSCGLPLALITTFTLAERYLFFSQLPTNTSIRSRVLTNVPHQGGHGGYLASSECLLLTKLVALPLRTSDTSDTMLIYVLSHRPEVRKSPATHDYAWSTKKLDLEQCSKKDVPVLPSDCWSDPLTRVSSTFWIWLNNLAWVFKNQLLWLQISCLLFSSLLCTIQFSWDGLYLSLLRPPGSLLICLIFTSAPLNSAVCLF